MNMDVFPMGMKNLSAALTVVAVAFAAFCANAADFTVTGCGLDETNGNYRRFTDATARIQDAVNSAWKSGGGRVTVEAGSYPITSIRLRSGVTLYLKSGAVLFASRNTEEYDIFKDDTLEPLPAREFTESRWIPPHLRIRPKGGQIDFINCAASTWNRGIIRAYGARDIALIGEPGSVIDGCNSYDPKGEDNYRGAHGLNIFHSTNIVLKGYTLRHTGNWAHRIQYAANVTCERVTVLGGHDGFHIRGGDHVRISDCTFHTGDDAIAGFDNFDVTVRGCDLSSACSAFRFGGRDILIENCHAHGPCEYPFRGSIPPQARRDGVGDPSLLAGGRCSMATFFLYFCDHSIPTRRAPGNIVVRNCRIENVHRFLRYNYGGELWQHARPMTDITFENCTATGMLLPLAANAGGPDEPERVPFTLTIRDSEFAFAASVSEFIECLGVKAVTLENVRLRGKALSAVRSWEGTPVLTLKDTAGLKDEIARDTGNYVCPGRRGI